MPTSSSSLSVPHPFHEIKSQSSNIIIGRNSKNIIIIIIIFYLFKMKLRSLTDLV